MASDVWNNREFFAGVSRLWQGIIGYKENDCNAEYISIFSTTHTPLWITATFSIPSRRLYLQSAKFARNQDRDLDG